MIINKRVTSLAVLIILWVAVISIVSYYFVKEKGLTINNIKIIEFFKRGEFQQKITREKTKSEIDEFPFRVGEKLKYGIYSVGLKVGNVDITYLGRKKINGVLMDSILVESKAPGFNDVETIYGKIDSFSPARVERKIRLFGEDIEITEEYDEVKKEVVITRRAKKTTVKKIASKDRIGNVILLLYHFRYKRDNYKIGDKIEFNLPTQRLEMLVDKETKIKVPSGNFTSLFVRSVPSRFKIWFRNDADSIPLRIQGAIGFGNTYLVLLDVE